MREVTQEQYAQIFSEHEVKVFSSFTDIEGTVPFGYGCPAMDTEWGIEGEDKPILRLESRKDNVEQKEWEHKYYVAEHLLEEK